MSAGPDLRRAAAARWAGAQFGLTAPAVLEPASADASFRRYFRCTDPRSGDTRIVMDAPPEHEDCRPFIQVAALIAQAGVHAPQVLASDLPQGFLLLTDLGSRTYLDALRGADVGGADALYVDALAALVRMQGIASAAVLPAYDRALLARELDLFPQWYLARHLRACTAQEATDALAPLFERLLASALAQPAVFVHRDYHSRNLMVCAPNPGVLDFQDAVHGPITYDLVSLLRDAYIDWDEAQQIDWLARYWQQARRAGLPVDSDFSAFYRDFEWLGVQRQLKVLGIFARLAWRDGKHAYIDSMPRVRGYLRAACARYADLAPLVRWLELETPAQS